MNTYQTLQLVDHMPPIAAACNAINAMDKRGICLPWVTTHCIVRTSELAPWKVRIAGACEVSQLSPATVSYWKKLPGSRWAAPEILRDGKVQAGVHDSSTEYGGGISILGEKPASGRQRRARAPGSENRHGREEGG